jgi:hypothetical protein
VRVGVGSLSVKLYIYDIIVWSISYFDNLESLRVRVFAVISSLRSLNLSRSQYFLSIVV